MKSWPLTLTLPVGTAVVVFSTALVLTLLGLFAVEQRESAVRADIATAFLDTLAGVVSPLVTRDADVDDIQRTLVSASGFKPALRNQGIAFCCTSDQVISAVEVTDGPDSLVTDELLSGFIQTQTDQRSADAVKRTFPKLEKFLIAKRYAAGTGADFQLAAAFNLDQVYQTQRATRRNAVLLDLGFALFAALVSYGLVRRALLPMERLTQSLADLQTTAVPTDRLAGGQTEVGKLQRVLNTRLQEQARAQALEDAERNRARDAVLARLAASVAHEVRNPLAGMSAAISTLRRFGEDKKVRDETADLLERGLSSIDRVAAGMLSTYRQEDGERDLQPSDISDLEMLARPKLTQKQITLDFQSELDVPFPASANPVRQIILNLLLNAAEAAPEGGQVAFSAALQDGALQLIVTDDGPGMPEKALAVVTQSNEGDVPRSGRLGLWLIHKL
ncbi:MAG: HAMP domain-containing sensor histidine kinase, partial [Pseudomonadota bacterium]